MESALVKLNKEEKRLVYIESDKDVFCNYDEEKKKALAKKIVQLSFFIGIKEPLSIDELKMMVLFLCKQFPFCTMPKLEDAFMKAASGELGEMEHYQSFSPQYVSKIIKAYDSISKQAMKKYNQEKEKQELQAKSDAIKDKYDPIEGCIQMLLVEFQRFSKKTKDEFNELDFHLCEWALLSCVKKGMFKTYNSDEITPERYLRAFFSQIIKKGKNIEDNIRKFVVDNSKNQ